MNNTWEASILKYICDLGGQATNKQIYKKIGNYYPLKNKHQEITIWGGRKAYGHQIRSHLSNLCDPKCKDLIRVSRGLYSITEKGRKRVYS